MVCTAAASAKKSLRVTSEGEHFPPFHRSHTRNRSALLAHLTAASVTIGNCFAVSSALITLFMRELEELKPRPADPLWSQGSPLSCPLTAITHSSKAINARPLHTNWMLSQVIGAYLWHRSIVPTQRVRSDGRSGSCDIRHFSFLLISRPHQATHTDSPHCTVMLTSHATE